MSINPIRFLVMPRFVALVLMMPIITLIDNVIGIVGGAVVGKYQIGVSYNTYFEWAFKYVDNHDLYTGLAKSVVFAVIIVTICCYQGLKPKAGAEGVGKGTIRSIVFSFLFILTFDYFLTRLFF